MLSFIIPAYNEELLLGATIEAMHAAARDAGVDYEIVVADDASADRTAEVAERGRARVVKANNRQIAATRNSGARAARGEHFMFVDADTLVTERVVRGAVRAMERGAAGGGMNVRFDEPVPPWARIVMPLLLTFYRILGMAPGCCLFCTRRAFERVGGFDERVFGAEELFMSRALGQCGPFVFLTDAVTTSGRKLRTYSLWEIATILGRFAVGGPRSLESRAGTEIWYGERRRDPGHVGNVPHV
jgi:glycosyltransferase involved in cell wall biosynthesis